MNHDETITTHRRRYKTSFIHFPSTLLHVHCRDTRDESIIRAKETSVKEDIHSWKITTKVLSEMQATLLGQPS